MSIKNECMVVTLQISMWTGHRLDKAASAKITREAGAADDAARVNKHLVAKETIKPIQTAANAIRSHLYDKTMPWKDNGDRLLTRTIYPSFIEEHERLVAVYNDAVETFLTKDYLAARERAEFRMGDMFNPNDYPSVTTLRYRFGVVLDVDAVTDGSDFRVDISDKADRAVELERRKNERLSKAMVHLWDRLADTLGHFADKMSSDAIFRNSTIKNLEELVEMIPGMNILNDPQLDAIRQKIADNLTGYEPDDLRKKPEVRSAVAAQANQIMADMRGFMNAMQEAA